MFLAILAIPFVALATEGHGAEGSHAGLDGATVKTIIYQFINIGLLIGGLIYFLRKSVKEFFASKKSAFIAEAEKAQSARLAAEQEHMQIQVRLNKLESTADESLSRARAEAAEMRNQMIAEAQALSKRIREEAHLSAQLEIERAKNHLREQMIKEAVESSRQQMNTKVSVDDHKRLQGEFINNIQAVPR